MYQKSKLRRINLAVLVVILSALLLCGGLAVYNFVIPASEPVEAATQMTIYQSSTKSYSSTRYDYPVYGKICLYCDNGGITSVTFTSTPFADGRASGSQYYFDATGSFNFSISITGYEWTSINFSARYLFFVSTSFDSAITNAKNSLDEGNGTEITYSRSGNSFATETNDEGIGGYANMYNNNSYLVLMIYLDKPSGISANSYTLTFSYNGGNTSTGSKTVVYDSAIGTLPTSSRPDYIFNGWYIGSTRIYETTIWRYASNQTATAQWTFDGYTLSTSVGTEGGGSISGAMDQYSKGATVRVQAVPNEGYAFDYWLLNGGRMIDNPLEFVIGQNSTLVAYFREVPTVVVSFTGGTGTSSSQTVGTMQYVVATPQTGYYVSTITVDGISFPVNYYEAIMYGAGNANRATYFAKDSTNAISMSFDYLWGRTEVVLNLSTVRPQLQIPPSTGGNFGVSGVVATATTGGEARITGFDTDDDYVHFSAISYSGYRFAGWTASDGTNLSEYGATADIPMDLVKDKVITANFEPNTNNSSSINGSEHNAGDEFS